MFVSSHVFWFSVGSFVFFFMIHIFSLALSKEKEHRAKDMETMRKTLRSTENRAEAVRLITESKYDDVEELIAQARLMHRGADCDLYEALQSMKNLELKVTNLES